MHMMYTQNDSYSRSLAIATILGGVWLLFKQAVIKEYIRQIFQVDAEEVPEFRCVYIQESESGSLEGGPAGGICKYRWQVDDDGIDRINCPKYDWPPWAAYYITPDIIFYVENEHIMIYEAFGPRFRCWKRGLLDKRSGALKIVDLRVIGSLSQIAVEPETE